MTNKRVLTPDNIKIKSDNNIYTLKPVRKQCTTLIKEGAPK